MVLWILALLACGDPTPKHAGGEPRADRGEGRDRDKERERRSERDHGRRGITSSGEIGGGRTLRRIDELGPDEPAFVALVVLDTVRADHTSLCGYGRPNTPSLERIRPLAKAWSCDGYSPGSWTLPSHASYFTGRPTGELDVHTLGTPLRQDVDTLAEQYAARGYQTLFVSANPVFAREEGGFWQGFDRVVVAEDLRSPLREDLAKILEEEVRDADPDAPLLVVLNVFDAHDPYPKIPKGLDWVEPMDRFSLHPHTAEDKNPYYRFVTGKMEEADKPEYLRRITDAYDHAVYEADANLGRAIQVFRGTGWLERKHRMVVTSDHGEHLGEHGLLRHGSATWQTVTHVPFLYFDNLRTTPLELPTPMSTRVAFHLLRDGRLPDEPVVVESASAENPDDFKPSWVTVSVWGAQGEKLTSWEGEQHRYDLTTDPHEERPLPVAPDDPLKAILDARWEAHTKSIAASAERGQDPALMKALENVGYVQ